MEQTSALISGCVLMALPVLIIAAAIRNSRGTTLRMPLVWALLAYLSLVSAAAMLRVVSGQDASKWVFIALSAACCPTVSLFGAKRPQNRAWQLIVLAFWFVLSLPAIQSLSMHQGEPFELHAVWRWFLAILIVASGVNYLATRFAAASLFVTLGYVLMFGNFLPWPSFLSLTGNIELGLFLIIAGICIAFVSNRRVWKRLSGYRGWNRTWLDFRDAFGVVWALRMMERVNTLPMAMQAGVRLNWGGFYELLPASGHTTCTTTSAEQAVAANQSGSLGEEIETHPASTFAMAPLDAGLRNLMRRFVSKRWLEARLNTTQKDAE